MPISIVDYSVMGEPVDRYNSYPEAKPERSEASSGAPVYSLANLHNELQVMRAEDRVKEQYQSRIEELRHQHEQDLRRKRDELDEYARKYNELNNQITQLHTKHLADLQAQAAQLKTDYSTEISELRKTAEQKEQRINELNESLRELKTKILIRDTEAKYQEKPLIPQIIDIAERVGPQVLGSIMHLFQQQQAQKQFLTNSKAQTNDDEGYHSQHSTPQNNGYENQSNDAGTDLSASSSPPEQPSPTVNQSPMPTPEEAMLTIETQFKNDVLTIANTALKDESHIQSLVEYIAHQTAHLADHGIELDHKLWIEIATTLADKAEKENISVDALTTVIYPVLEQKVKSENIRTMLQTLPALVAANALFAYLGIEPSEGQRRIITEVLSKIKQKL
ncbi:MAG: hypothetical protein LAT67_05050 [Balneolales bacterium]|nr:hypothetical protein [Balneolales bacterium]